MTTPDLPSHSPSVAPEVRQRAELFHQRFQALREQVGRVLVGQHEVVEYVLLAILAGGHVLLEGVPGLGKTLLVRTLGGALSLEFNRVQFTPDLMPADITGTNIVGESAGGSREFRFQRGPLFANLVLADEINRATPKTQSALLEAMQEHSVTVAGTVHRLPEPFFVLATQNPLEQEGTYPLPEAQLDRFLFKVLVPYPSLDDLRIIIERTTGTSTPGVDAILTGPQIEEMQALAREIHLGSSVRDYALRLVLATHPDQNDAPATVKRFVRCGSSPRGAQAIILTAKLRALLDNRFNVAMEDVDAVLAPALRHRLLLNFEGEAEGASTDDVVSQVRDHVRAQFRSDLKI